MISSRRTIDIVEIFGAELIGTAFMMYFGCTGIIPNLNPLSPVINSLHAALVFAFIVTSCIVIFGPISGAHMNPAVTLSALIYNRISLLVGLVYLVAECLGSCLGIWLVKLTTPSEFYPRDCCCVKFHLGLSFSQAFIAEFMGTSILIFAVCSAWDPRNAQAQDSMPIKFGLVVGAIIFGVGNYTCANINPARSFGPALVNNFWDHQWFYWVVSLAASASTTLLYKFTFLKKYETFSGLKSSSKTQEKISGYSNVYSEELDQKNVAISMAVFSDASDHKKYYSMQDMKL